MSNHHVGAGEIPPKAWLQLFARWACATHGTLVANSRRCHSPSCRPANAGEQPYRGDLPQPSPFLTPTLQPPPPTLGTPLSSPPPPGLADGLDSVLRTHVPLFRHVPKGAQAAWGAALAHRIQDLALHRTWEALLDLLAFPKLTLTTPYRGKPSTSKMTSDVLDRLGALRSQGSLSLIQASGDLSRPRPKRGRPSPCSSLADKQDRLEDTAFQNSLKALMADGAFSKAVCHLLSEGIHDASDPSVIEVLRTKHPRAPPAPPLEPLPDPLDWDETPEGEEARLREIREIVLRFPLASGAGPSGLRPQHLQDLLRQDHGSAGPLNQALDALIRACLDGKFPASAAPYLCGANLIPLRKGPDGSAVRPVAVGETLWRVVAKFAASLPCAHLAAQELLPHQCGVSVPGACETVAMGLQALTHSLRPDSDVAVLQVDCANAFNCIDRRAVLSAVRSDAPELMAWAHFCYASQSPLYCGGHTLWSQQGVQQGNPLGPLFFALAWQRVVSVLPDSLHLNCWYLDDGHLVGPLTSIAEAADTLRCAGHEVGIELNTAKCTLWGPGVPPSLPASLSGFRVVPWTPGSGITALGLPISYPGCERHAAAHLNSLTSKLQDVCHLIAHLREPHHQHLLLRFCADACRILHFLRAVDCSKELRRIVGDAAGAIRRCMEDIVGVGSLDAAKWAQCCLPLRLGGMGVKDPALLADCARVAACLSFLHRAPDLAFPPCSLSFPLDFMGVVQRL